MPLTRLVPRGENLEQELELVSHLHPTLQSFAPSASPLDLNTAAPSNLLSGATGSPDTVQIANHVASETLHDDGAHDTQQLSQVEPGSLITAPMTLVMAGLIMLLVVAIIIRMICLLRKDKDGQGRKVRRLRAFLVVGLLVADFAVACVFFQSIIG